MHADFWADTRVTLTSIQTNKAGRRRREGFCALLSSSIIDQEPDSTILRDMQARPFLAALATFSIPRPGRSIRHPPHSTPVLFGSKRNCDIFIAVSRVTAILTVQQ